MLRIILIVLLCIYAYAQHITLTKVKQASGHDILFIPTYVTTYLGLDSRLVITKVER